MDELVSVFVSHSKYDSHLRKFFAEIEKLRKENKESTQNRQLIDDLQTQLVQLQFELKAVTTSVQTKYDDELQQRKEKLVID